MPKSVLAAALLLTLLTAGAVTVRGQDPVPMLPYGVVYVDGQPAEDGTLVQAKIGGEVVRSGYTYTAGGDRGQYVLVIPGKPGDEVHFFALDIEAEESPKTWRSGEYHLDLHVTTVVLRTTITSPTEGETYSTEQEFTVSAEVENTGLEAATKVTATITVSPSNSALLVWPADPEQSLGTIESGAKKEAIWTLQCAASGPADITVAPDGRRADTGVPIPERHLIPATVTVTQEKKAHLVVSISSPVEGESFSTGEEFVVTATVSDTGEADALGVSAVLSVTGGAQLADPATATQDVGDLAGGGSSVANWTLVCTSSEAATIVVTPAGTDENTGEAIPPLNVESASVTVNSHPRLVVGITAPGVVAVDTSFAVQGTVSNTGGVDAIGVILTLNVTGGASLVEGAERTIGALDAGATSDPVSWTLHCNSMESAVVEVSPEGIEVNTGSPIPEDNLISDEATVYQGLAIYLPLICRNYAP